MKLQSPAKKIVCFVFFILISICLLAQNPPSYFDLRDVNGTDYVTSVKNQRGGTCWTHGAMAAVEGNLMITGAWTAAGENGEPNLSEYHLDWWNGFNEHNNNDLDPPDGFGLTVHEGGDYRVTAAYMTRGEGAVYSPDANDETEYDDNWFDNPPERYDEDYHYYYARDIEWYTMDAYLDNINIVKNMIMTHGVMGTCMYSSGKYRQEFIHYQPPNSTEDPNHAIAIVGWDDDKITQAPLPGAWICKNSWGSAFGEGGYFWISYYDKHSGRHPEMGAVSFQHVERFRYQHIYCHDYHGWRNTKTNCYEAFNAFAAEETEYLAAVSFYTATDNVVYEIRIYDRFENGELDPVFSALKTGTIDYSGFHTIDLDSPVLLNQGDEFYIYVYLSAGGHPYDCTSVIPVLLGSSNVGTVVESHAEPGESYYYDGSEWVDLTDDDASANFCIKGLTVSDPGDVNLPETVQLTQNYPNPFNSKTKFNFYLSESGFVELKIFNVKGQEVITLENGYRNSGASFAEWDSYNNRGQRVGSGVYIYRLKTQGKVTSRRMVLLK